MACKIVFVVCLLAVSAQMTLAQCNLGAGLGVPNPFAASLPNPGLVPSCAAANNPGLGAIGYGPGLPYGSGVGYGSGSYGIPFEVAPTHGGGFIVTSTSATAPSGISITSDNTIQGSVIINGELPLYGTAALEGNTPSSGIGIANYGCGNGVTAIESFGVGPGLGNSNYGAVGGFSSGLSGLSSLSGFGHLAGCGCAGHI